VPGPSPTPANDNLRGSLWMVAAMAGFAVEDMFLKSAAAELPVGQVMVIFGSGGMLLFACLTKARGEALFPVAMLHPAILIRALFEVSGRLFYTLAIALTPLSSASAILQASPLMVVAGAALVFGERVGWRRWTAICMGFAGVLIILRPGADSFTPLSLFAVLGTIGFAGRDLATRAAPPGLSNMQLGVYGFAMIVLAGAGMLALFGGAAMPGPRAAFELAAGTLIGVGAYYAITAAMRTGSVGVVTPFRYTRLVFALILGVLVFGERPDALTLTGSAVIVTSGLYTLLRSRRVVA
jgi:drug/metabolite transporter (DMT)-like permease